MLSIACSECCTLTCQPNSHLDGKPTQFIAEQFCCPKELIRPFAANSGKRKHKQSQIINLKMKKAVEGYSVLPGLNIFMHFVIDFTEVTVLGPAAIAHVE